MEITYLAVDEEVQSKGIGTAALKIIVEKVRRIGNNIPISRYIAINSLLRKVAFYQKRGLHSLGDHTKNGKTQFMYLGYIEDRSSLFNVHMDQNGSIFAQVDGFDKASILETLKCKDFLVP